LYVASYPWYATASEIERFASFYKPLSILDGFLQQCGIAGGITAVSAVMAFFLVKSFLTDNGTIKALSRFGKHTYTIYLSHMTLLG
ncbi:hypothetical protein, partial [Serratia liquefaciens]|uniref:hypothetical protein n=1 Tax=Serratia liquefaciens TaxID=614 RepID=UPI0023626E02